MKASFTSRITCSVLAATLAALPCNEALAAPAATATTPTTTTPPAAGAPAKPATTSPAPTSTAPTSTAPTSTPTTTTSTTTSTGTTTTTAPTTGTTPTTGAPTETDPRGVDGTGAITAPGETPTDVSGETPPEGETPPVEPPPPVVEEPPAPPPAPVGPERPPEPTVANGKYKAKGTGLMIAGGSLLGLGVIGLVTSYFLTRCDDIDNSFACKNKQNSTFAVPATGAAALLGAVLLAVGVGYRVRYKKWENWKPSANPQKTALYPTLLRGGAGVGYTLKF